MVYTAYLSSFHSHLCKGEYDSFQAALAATSCGGSCMCGGGYVMAKGHVVDLGAMPFDVLAGEREPSESEVK